MTSQDVSDDGATQGGAPSSVTLADLLAALLVGGRKYIYFIKITDDKKLI